MKYGRRNGFQRRHVSVLDDATKKMPWCPFSLAGCKVKSKYNYMEDKDVKDRGGDSDQGSLAARWHNMPWDPIKSRFFSPLKLKKNPFSHLHPPPLEPKEGKKETAFSYFCPLAILIIFVPAVSPSTANTAPPNAWDTAVTVEARVTISQMMQNTACVFHVMDKRYSPLNRLRWPGCWEWFVFWPFGPLLVWFQSE